MRNDCGFLQGKREGFNEQLEESDDLTSLPAADLQGKREGFNEQLEESDDLTSSSDTLLTSLPAADLLTKILAEHD